MQGQGGYEMARGWESKAVEEQQSQTIKDQPDSRKRAAADDDGHSSPEQRLKMAQRGSLELALKRVRNDLALADNDRRKQMLEAAAADLERRLKEF
jgi:hypothetical protein